ncbi:hypothetical protein [Amycolatopsis japonica]
MAGIISGVDKVAHGAFQTALDKHLHVSGIQTNLSATMLTFHDGRLALACREAKVTCVPPVVEDGTSSHDLGTSRYTSNVPGRPRHHAECRLSFSSIARTGSKPGT